METFTLYDYKILSTGVDGGHYYLTSDIKYKGLIRKVVVLFDSKKDESRLIDNAVIGVQGNLIDQGLPQSLILNDAILMYLKLCKDKEVLKVLRARDGVGTQITLWDGRKVSVWNIAEGYDIGEAYSNLTTNISPSIEGATIDLINTSKIAQVSDPLTQEVLYESK